MTAIVGARNLIGKQSGRLGLHVTCACSVGGDSLLKEGGWVRLQYISDGVEVGA